jgi:hypothetical protein
MNKLIEVWVHLEQRFQWMPMAGPLPKPNMMLTARFVATKRTKEGLTKSPIIGYSREFSIRESDKGEYVETPDRQQYLAELIAILTAQGWELINKGAPWYNYRLRRSV